jgi:hypothetical protein
LLADDTAGLVSGPELHPLPNKAKLELQKIGMWFRANKMAVNVSKHRYITSRFKMSISADVHPWEDFSLLTAPPPTTSGVKSY